jgi:hypothetical protein
MAAEPEGTYGTVGHFPLSPIYTVFGFRSYLSHPPLSLVVILKAIPLNLLRTTFPSYEKWPIAKREFPFPALTNCLFSMHPERMVPGRLVSERMFSFLVTNGSLYDGSPE